VTERFNICEPNEQKLSENVLNHDSPLQNVLKTTLSAIIWLTIRATTKVAYLAKYKLSRKPTCDVCPLDPLLGIDCEWPWTFLTFAVPAPASGLFGM